jgi:hypothetical protein
MVAPGNSLVGIGRPSADSVVAAKSVSWTYPDRPVLADVSSPRP